MEQVTRGKLLSQIRMSVRAHARLLDLNPGDGKSFIIKIAIVVLIPAFDQLDQSLRLVSISIGLFKSNILD